MPLNVYVACNFKCLIETQDDRKSSTLTVNVVMSRKRCKLERLLAITEHQEEVIYQIASIRIWSVKFCTHYAANTPVQQAEIEHCCIFHPFSVCLPLCNRTLKRHRICC